jgi:hypothetical protein
LFEISPVLAQMREASVRLLRAADGAHCPESRQWRNSVSHWIAAMLWIQRLAAGAILACSFAEE